jgi:hypothetical protein
VKTTTSFVYQCVGEASTPEWGCVCRTPHGGAGLLAPPPNTKFCPTVVRGFRDIRANAPAPISVMHTAKESLSRCQWAFLVCVPLSLSDFWQGSFACVSIFFPKSLPRCKGGHPVGNRPTGAGGVAIYFFFPPSGVCRSSLLVGRVKCGSICRSEVLISRLFLVFFASSGRSIG